MKLINSLSIIYHMAEPDTGNSVISDAVVLLTTVLGYLI